MKSEVKDLKTDIMNSIDSSYAEYGNPECEFVVENIRGVFMASEAYNYPSLREEIVETVRFEFSEGRVPDEEVLRTTVESAILKWRLG